MYVGGGSNNGHLSYIARPSLHQSLALSSTTYLLPSVRLLPGQRDPPEK
jgi:hypothetical protein